MLDVSVSLQVRASMCLRRQLAFVEHGMRIQYPLCSSSSFGVGGWVGPKKRVCMSAEITWGLDIETTRQPKPNVKEGLLLICPKQKP